MRAGFSGRFVGATKAAKAIAEKTILILAATAVALVLAELLFRACIYLGIARAVTEIYSTKPYGYYFWAREGGHPTGINNRYGYADQDYEPVKAPGSTRIAIIGDSFVEALQVPIAEKMGPVLQSRLNSKTPRRYEVISLGRSGEYPAYYLERLKYAVAHFQATIVFVVICMENDFRNASFEIEHNTSGMRPDRYIFYEVNHATGSVRPRPESIPLIESFDRQESSNWGRRPRFIERIDLWLHRIFLLYSEIPARITLFRRWIQTPSGVPGEVVNPGFESGTDGWLAGNGAKLTVTKINGQRWLSVANTHPGRNGYAQQAIAVDSGACYQLSVRMRRGEGRSQPTVYVGEEHAIAKYLEHTTSSDDVEKFSEAFIATGSRVVITFQVGADMAAAQACFAGVSLKKLPSAAPPVGCTEESIYIKSRGACWTDSVSITNALVAEMKRFAETNHIRLFFLGIPANETFWDDETLNETAHAVGAKVPQLSYAHLLAEKFAVPPADVDLQRPDRMLRRIMDANSANYLDLMDSFREYAIRHRHSPYSGWFNGHLNRQGHLLVATEMKRLLDSPVSAGLIGR